jgi:hypothetical protein
MADPELTAWYEKMLRAGFDEVTSDDDPISEELDAKALQSLLLSADRLALQLEHSILDAPWLREQTLGLVDDWIHGPGETLDLAELRTSLETLFSPERALTIARSETAGVFNGGMAAGLRAHGWTQVVWIAAQDACDECAALDGTVLSLDEYEADPTAHPNCSCTAEPYTGEQDEEEDGTETNADLAQEG